MTYRRLCVAMAATGAVLVTGTGSAQAATTASCKASAVTAQVAGGSVLDPVAAGGTGTPCQPAVTGLPNTTEALGLDDLIRAKTAYAVADPALTQAGVEGLDVLLGSTTLSVGAARSSIAPSCADGAAAYDARSEVASLSIGGQVLVLDGVLQPITDGLNQAVGAVVQVKLNEVVDLPGGGKAVRAAHVTLLRGDTPVADVVVAESRAADSGSPCTQVPTGRDDGSKTPAVCPPGSVLDASRAVCVIPAPGSQTSANPGGDLNGVESVVVGKPYEGPKGGSVMTLAEARTTFKSPCLRGPGPKYIVLGTNRADRITGTNRRDRILGRGGRDRIDGGRNRDCIDGGAARDVMTGGQEADRVYGHGGRDVVNGDSGNDLLVGGVGNDSFNAGYGADRVHGGRGRDAINVATAGKRAHVWGGKGYDIVRCNPEELRFVRGAERVHEVIRIRG
jgi:hypothetical protein